MMVLYPALQSWRQDDEELRAIPDYIVRPRSPWDIELSKKKMVLRKHKKDRQTHSQTNPKKKIENSKLVKLDMKKGDDAKDST